MFAFERQLTVAQLYSAEAVIKPLKERAEITGHTESGVSTGFFPHFHFLLYTLEVSTGDGTLWETLASAVVMEQVVGSGD